MLRRLSRKGSSSSLDPKTVRAKFLEFIDSSIWALPIATFIEQRSVVFDRQQGNADLYEQIHKEFSELVDTLVECFCADTNIPLNTLRDALKSAEPDQFTLRQRTSLEPLAAAKDFNVFVPMMMRKNVELQLQALQMIEFMCGLLPSVLQIEDGESLKNKARVISPEETERYVLIAVMRQSKEEFDQFTKNEMEELEEVLRSSEEERKRLEEERGREQELYNRALAASNESEKSNQKQEGSAALSSSGVEKTTSSAPRNEASTAVSEETPFKTAESAQTTASTTSTDSKSNRLGTAKKNRRGSVEERPPSTRPPAASENDRRASAVEKTSAMKASAPSEKTPPRTRADGRPPTAKRANMPSVPAASTERAALKSGKERKPTTETRKRTEEDNVNADVEKKADTGTEEEGVTYGPRAKNIYDVNALLRERNRLNSAAVRSREEYLRHQRDRLLAMKANEREKQMNEVSQRAAQERPRTARAARGLMRGSRGGIGNDEILATRKAIMDQLKTEIEDSSAP